MSLRERTLALIVGSAIAFLVNMVLIKFFLTKKGEFQTLIVKSEGDLTRFKQLEPTRALWAKRTDWINQNISAIGDPQVANRDLAAFVKDIAKKYTVTIETPNPGTPVRQANYVSLGMRVSAKAEWANMLDFLHELQGPGHFVVFDPLDLKVDVNDKSQLRAEVTVTKWFGQ